jgi:tRNA-2-methylthio-N6-dimethylallyladenosine synthase
MASTLVSPADLARAAPPKPKRGTYFVQTWGCQMNEDDSSQIGLFLERIGFEPGPSLHAAHVILLNTCSVRKKPEDKAFSMLGEIALLKGARPEIVVGVCGCMAQLRAEEIRKRAPFVDFVVGTGQIAAVPGLVEEALQLRKFRSRLELPERKGAVVTDVPERALPRSSREVSGSLMEVSGALMEVPGSLRDSQSAIQNPKSEIQNPLGLPKLKAFLPIQYGCDKFCTFCIVPTTRGRERSRPTEDVVREARALAAAGTREITLLGQTVNSYGKNLAEGRVPFSKLLRLLGGVPGLERIRYTSPYPRDFTPDLIGCIRDCPQVMEHVHLPLQSGSGEMLRAMRRVYTVEGFLSIVAALREAVPWIGLTTDVIVGFPGETEEQFAETMRVVEEVRFDGAFMFAYSPRPGTPAAEMKQVPAPVKKRRLNELIALQSRITMERNAEWVGKEMEVLVEGPSPKDPGRLQGYSREFRMVHFEAAPSLRGEIVRVAGEKAHPWGLSARLLERA